MATERTPQYYPQWEMLNILELIIATELPELLRDTEGWNSLYINYHHPYVERVWRQWGNYRICCHRIHPCPAGERPLFHPHPWPAAIRLIEGQYESAIGYSRDEQPPPYVATAVLAAPSMYEMCHPNGWHYVNPMRQPALSLMVTGKPWSEKATHQPDLGPLTDEVKLSILTQFQEHFPPTDFHYDYL